MAEENAIVEIKKEVNKVLSDPETLKSLVDTTFKGLQEQHVKRAIMEGMMRGFSFKDFLEKNIYAVPFGGAYSLVTSIDYARKVGMRSGIVGKSAPSFEEKDGKIVSCTVTVKKKASDYIGDYSATVYFNEYSTGKNLWISKPRTMIAKVAEMHALRMACPEELSQSYIEEEFSQERKPVVVIDITESQKKLEAVKTLDELKTVWSALPAQAKKELGGLKDQLKEKFEKPAEPKEEKKVEKVDEEKKDESN